MVSQISIVCNNYAYYNITLICCISVIQMYKITKCMLMYVKAIDVMVYMMMYYLILVKKYY